MIGRIYVPDEGGGGAYHIEGGVLCHAPLLPPDLGGGFDWFSTVQVDPRAFEEDDPGWDFARWAREALLARMNDGEARCDGPHGSTHEFNEGHSFCACGYDRWEQHADVA